MNYAAYCSQVLTLSFLKFSDWHLGCLVLDSSMGLGDIRWKVVVYTLKQQNQMFFKLVIVPRHDI